MNKRDELICSLSQPTYGGGEAQITFKDTPVPERGGEMGVNSSSSEIPRVLVGSPLIRI